MFGKLIWSMDVVLSTCCTIRIIVLLSWSYLLLLLEAFCLYSYSCLLIAYYLCNFYSLCFSSCLSLYFYYLSFYSIIEFLNSVYLNSFWTLSFSSLISFSFSCDSFYFCSISFLTLYSYFCFLAILLSSYY